MTLDGGRASPIGRELAAMRVSLSLSFSLPAKAEFRISSKTRQAPATATRLARKIERAGETRMRVRNVRGCKTLHDAVEEIKRERCELTFIAAGDGCALAGKVR